MLCRHFDITLKDSMQLMQKTYLFPVQKDSSLQMHLKTLGHTDTVLFPIIGKVGDILLLYLSKEYIGSR
jgi:hypothetical protein